MDFKRLGALFLMGVSCCACSKPVPIADPVAQSVQSQGSRSSSSSAASHIDDPIKAGGFSDSRAKEAWKRFVASGSYRWARPQDFRIPNWAMKAYQADIAQAISAPLKGGDINHDGAVKDIAVIVVDQTRSDWFRFGIVIFNEPKDDQNVYSVHWLYKDVDLSRVVLDWSSSGLGVTQYGEDRSYAHCFVEWDEKRQAYKCNLTTLPFPPKS